MVLPSSRLGLGTRTSSSLSSSDSRICCIFEPLYTLTQESALEGTSLSNPPQAPSAQPVPPDPTLTPCLCPQVDLKEQTTHTTGRAAPAATPTLARQLHLCGQPLPQPQDHQQPPSLLFLLFCLYFLIFLLSFAQETQSVQSPVLPVPLELICTKSHLHWLGFWSQPWSLSVCKRVCVPTAECVGLLGLCPPPSTPPTLGGDWEGARLGGPSVAPPPTPSLEAPNIRSTPSISLCVHLAHVPPCQGLPRSPGFINKLSYRNLSQDSCI